MATKAAMIAEIGTNFPDNTSGLITPALTRTTHTDEVNSWQQAPQVNAQGGTLYTIVASDYGQLLLFSNASPVAVTIPSASGFSPFNVLIKNNGAGLVTITPALGTIDGAVSLVLSTGQSAWLVSDSVNWRTGFFTFNAVTNIETIIDAGASVITTGVKADLEVPFNGTILGWTLLADVSGSIVVDIWSDTFGNYPPVVGDSITGGSPPTMSAAAKAQSSVLTGWNTLLTAGTTLRFNVNSVASVHRVTVSLRCLRS